MDHPNDAPETAVVLRPGDNRAIAIPTPQGQLVPDWWARAYGPVTMYVTSLDKTKPDQKAALLASLIEESDGSESWINQDLQLTGYTIMPASRVVNGEVQEWVRTILYLDGGGRVSFGSMGIIKSLMLIQQLDRPAPWNPPLVKRLIGRKLADGKNWLALVDPPPAKAADKKLK